MSNFLSENAQKVLNLLQANPGADLTAYDIAEATGIDRKAINGVITGIQKAKTTRGFNEGFVIREEQEEKTEDGKVIKYIRLTETGAALDPAAELPAVIGKDAE